MNYILYKEGGCCSVEAIRTRLPAFVQELIVIFWVIMYDEVNNRLRGGETIEIYKIIISRFSHSHSSIRINGASK